MNRQPLAPPPFLSYGVILADFPTEFQTYSAAGQAKGASQHYSTMSTDEIIALYDSLNLDWICAPDVIFAMWTTWSLLANGDAHKIMTAYRFKPISGGAWLKKTKHGKDGFGLGYMFRDSCEPFLIGVRGEPGMPKRGARNWRNGFQAQLREHSRKPDYLHRAFEAMYPKVSKLELFGRASRPGWEVWGNEATKFDTNTEGTNDQDTSARDRGQAASPAGDDDHRDIEGDRRQRALDL